MNAIRRVDLQLLAAFTVRDHLVHIGGTEIRAGIAEIRDAARRAQVGVGDVQVDGLIFIVRGRGEEYECNAIARRQRSIAPAPVRRNIFIEALERRAVGMIGQCPGQFSHGDGFQSKVRGTQPQAAPETGANVAHLV